MIDAFTDIPFRGNPTAVCILDTPREDTWLQSVAFEMNLPESAFAMKQQNNWNLRWFTPTNEVPLCGHATLATAHALWDSDRVDMNEEIRFQTASGMLNTRNNKDMIEMDFPLIETESRNLEPQVEGFLATALNVKIKESYRAGEDILILLEDEALVRNLKPDLIQLKEMDVRGFIVTGPNTNSSYDFISRFFAPRIGIPEDHVTGSAHCALGPFWGKRLKKGILTGYQASGRGGVVSVELYDDHVNLKGRAVTVMKGHLVI